MKAFNSIARSALAAFAVICVPLIFTNCASSEAPDSPVDVLKDHPAVMVAGKVKDGVTGSDEGVEESGEESEE